MEQHEHTVIQIPKTSDDEIHPPPRPRPPPPPPPLPYIIGIRENYLKLVVPLYEASIIGDWETAKMIFEKRRDMVRIGLSTNFGTALHVAAAADETEHTLNFVKNLVNMMTMEELKLQNEFGKTAFWIACSAGKREEAKIMLEKNRDLKDIPSNDGCMPLTICAINGKDASLVKFLYDNSNKMMGDHWSDDDRVITLLECVERDFFALRMGLPDILAQLGRVGLVS